MRLNKVLASFSLSLPILLSACAADGSFSADQALALGSNVVQAATLDESQVKATAAQAAQEMDSKQKIAPANSPYVKRLTKLTQGLAQASGLDLNYKVYMTDQINAFAMADGTVRVYSALMDAMPDDQVLAVLGHEVGHVKLKHSYKQMREQLLTDTAFKAAISTGGTIGSLTSGQLGQLAQSAINAHFSQGDELEADNFSVHLLKQMGKDPYAMKRAIGTLQAKYGNGGGFLSSHPSNPERIEKIQEAIDHL